jgi:predicted permease
MIWLPRLARRLRLLLHRAATESSMDAELHHHIESEIADRIRGGMSAADARRTTLRDFGSIEAIKEAARDARGIRPLEDLALDLRYAARVLARNRGFTVAAVMTFALGVGAVTAIFSLVYGILLRPLPYADPDRLVALWERNVARDMDRNVVSLDNYEAWRERARSFEGMAAIVPTSMTLAADAVPERLVGAEVTPGYFGLLGVLPAIGRDFLPADARDGAAVVLSDALWKRRFGADSAIVGRLVTMSGKPFTIVGVMPANFDPPRFGWLGEQDFWLPLVATEQSRSWGRFLLVVARLRAGVSLEQSRAEMIAVARQRARESSANDGWSASVVPLAEQITGEVEPSLLVLLAAVALLLLMAVANVATLTLSVMGRRGHELAIRRAIGATDRRLFQQLFTQSAVLGVVGAAVGAAVAVPGVHVLVRLLPPDSPRATSIAVDAPVLLVTTAVASFATLLFGTLAAVRGRRIGGPSPLGRNPGSERRTMKGGSALLTAEIAMAVALSVMAVLMLRSFAGLRAVDLGFTPRGVVIARIALPGSGYGSPDRQRLFFDRVAERVRALPGVKAAGVISARPFGGLGAATTVRDAARAPAPHAQDPVADVRSADPGLFPALGIPVQNGALFDARDSAGRSPSALISANLARALWPDRDAVGRELAIEMYGGLVATVAGVVGDIHLIDARTPPRPVVYLSAARFPSNVQDLVVRVDGPPDAIVPSLRAAVGSIDRSVPLYAVTTLPRLVDRSLAGDRLTTLLLSAFAAVALLLAGVGVFGIFAGDVARRRKEIGIRLALGARESGVVSMVLAAALRRAVLGVAAGAVLAAVLGRAMQSLLFGVVATDPVSFMTVAAAVTALALAATLVPTRQALNRDPLRSLREE